MAQKEIRVRIVGANTKKSWATGRLCRHPSIRTRKGSVSAHMEGNRVTWS
jgi:hypothetical protein